MCEHGTAQVSEAANNCCFCCLEKEEEVRHQMRIHQAKESRALLLSLCTENANPEYEAIQIENQETKGKIYFKVIQILG